MKESDSLHILVVEVKVQSRFAPSSTRGSATRAGRGKTLLYFHFHKKMCKESYSFARKREMEREGG